ncbi:MAG: hypothetical protein QOJ17_2029, partial [Rhodospirillaceae bacterium]|nr:hypothetical protein [Rhodospirillaceae bacterium]
CVSHWLTIGDDISLVSDAGTAVAIVQEIGGWVWIGQEKHFFSKEGAYLLRSPSTSWLYVRRVLPGGSAGRHGRMFVAIAGRGRPVAGHHQGRPRCRHQRSSSCRTRVFRDDECPGESGRQTSTRFIVSRRLGMTARPIPRRHRRSYGTDPLQTGTEALDEPFRAFPSWFMRVTCDRCGQERMFSIARRLG